MKKNTLLIISRYAPYGPNAKRVRLLYTGQVVKAQSSGFARITWRGNGEQTSWSQNHQNPRFWNLKEQITIRASKPNLMPTKNPTTQRKLRRCFCSNIKSLGRSTWTLALRQLDEIYLQVEATEPNGLGLVSAARFMGSERAEVLERKGVIFKCFQGFWGPCLKFWEMFVGKEVGEETG